MLLKTLYTRTSNTLSLVMITVFVTFSSSAFGQSSTGGEIFNKLDSKLKEATDQTTNIAYIIAFLFFIVGCIMAIRGRGADSWGMAGKAMMICFLISIAVPLWAWLQS